MANIVSELLKEAYRGQITFQFPELVEEYGFDAVWKAMGQLAELEFANEIARET